MDLGEYYFKKKSGDLRAHTLFWHHAVVRIPLALSHKLLAHPFPGYYHAVALALYHNLENFGLENFGVSKSNIFFPASVAHSHMNNFIGSACPLKFLVSLSSVSSLSYNNYSL